MNMEPVIRSAVRTVRSIRDCVLRRHRLRQYLRGGRIPWSQGYVDYRNDKIREVLRDPRLLESFRSHDALPDGFGSRLDERVIEYPWTFARLKGSAGRLLDAGSALNHEFLLSEPALREKSIVFFTLAPESFHSSPNLSYVFGDLRETVLRDETFDEIVCISTLEHVGMDNTKLYSSETRHKERSLRDYRLVMRELHRLLVPGGRLIVTVPFGRRQDLGWLQNFDNGLLDDAIQSFEGELADEGYYRYTPEGWMLSNRKGCDDCAYFDVHSHGTAPDLAAAARGVACLELRR